jgi:cardiolipin synthase
MNLSQLPNLITLSRIALVPALILLLKDQDYTAALVVFAIAGVSDGLDGLLAKRLGHTSQLGAILDPIADKILLVSAYVMLTVLGHLPFWLMLVVAFRDLTIVGGYLAYTSLIGPVQMRPSLLSKLNTVIQIALVVLVLVEQAVAHDWPLLVDLFVVTVAATTVASGAHYVWVWGLHKPGEAGARRDERRD